VDDGSTDQTAEVARRYGARIRYFRQANGGPATARNAGLRAARGEWIAFLDSDDMWWPHKLEFQSRWLTEPALWCGRVITFTEEAPAFPLGDAPAKITPLSLEQLLQRNRIVTSTVVAPRKALLAVGGFDPRFCGPEDFHCWLKLAAAGLPIRHAATPMTGYRITANSLSQKVSRMRDQERAIIEEFTGSGSRIWRQAMAGVCYRAAIGYAEAKQTAAARRELLQSWLAWPLRLAEYSPISPLPRLRLLARLWLRGRQHAGSNHPKSCCQMSAV
jgi:glycosyltransferase involved in cell wall biosynthesis